jgi:curved DNA-binding protein
LEEALKGSTRQVTLQRQNPRGGAAGTETYQVRIPPGIHEGQKIRLAGQGGKVSGRGRPGDLYLRVRLERHPDFRVKGSDLFYELDLAPWEATLGCRVEIPTLEGKVSLRVPAGTSSGQQLRLKGKGMPQGEGIRGDLYAVIHIKIPSNLTEREQKLWEELSKTSNFNPRV